MTLLLYFLLILGMGIGYVLAALFDFLKPGWRDRLRRYWQKQSGGFRDWLTGRIPSFILFLFFLTSCFVLSLLT
jgi:hypothetical protein